MDFLSKTDHYNQFVVAEKCKKSGLFKEQAFLYIKIGKTKEATQVLIDGAGDDVRSAIDLALKFGVDDEVLWESILNKSKGDAASVSQLLVYADVYDHPERFIDQYPDHLNL
jgi:hypothetical protein